MKILLINSICGTGSTGRICADLADRFTAEGHQVRIAYGRDGFVPENARPYAVRIGSDLGVRLHGIRARLLDGQGFGSKAATRAFLRWADSYQPDLVWLHNIHGYYLNVEMLFDWIKSRPEMEVRWTLHDCWSFTGRCSHFSYVGCDRWQTGCGSCPQKEHYPATFTDRSHLGYQRKKAAFTGVQHMTLFTPSQWLADRVKQSFLGCYPVQVQYNTVNTDVFKPTPGDFRQRLGLADKIIVLGAASTWDRYKGLYDFHKLRQLLDDSYAIVLVGLTEAQQKELPTGILGLPRTHSQQELAEIYTAADVFVNPSYEETFGLTAVEARACGTEAIVYQNTACEEIVDRLGGIAVPQDVDALAQAIRDVARRQEKETL